MTLHVGGWKSANQPVNEMSIKETEEILGVNLPESYIALMKNWNGGYLQDEHQILIKEKIPENLQYYLGEGFFSLSALAGISTDVNNSEGIVYTATTAHEWKIPKKIIAFDGDGHTWIAFDYRENADEPKIIFIESDNLASFEIASNFTSFIDLLIPSNEVYDYDGNIIYKS